MPKIQRNVIYHRAQFECLLAFGLFDFGGYRTTAIGAGARNGDKRIRRGLA